GEVLTRFTARLWGTEESGHSASAQSGKKPGQSVMLAFVCHCEISSLVELRDCLPDRPEGDSWIFVPKGGIHRFVDAGMGLADCSDRIGMPR
ncbi:MAG: hypothetical protein WA374_00755, partial [Acidobacteriaceae bacterium]